VATETTEAFAVVGGPGDSSTLTNVLTAKASLPTLAAPLSQGMAGGKLLLQVPPVYPQHEKSMRIEGRVVLTALIKEDGSVASVKVVEGSSVLAQSAVEAVRQWRYQPFVFNGSPVTKEMTITINFKLP
jgi:protein TonB